MAGPVETQARPACAIYLLILSLDMLSFDMPSFFIVSLDILSLDILSFAIESLDIESFDMLSLDIVSFFISSAKAAGASGANARPAATSADRSVLFFIEISSGRLKLHFLASMATEHVLISFPLPEAGVRLTVL